MIPMLDTKTAKFNDEYLLHTIKKFDVLRV